MPLNGESLMNFQFSPSSLHGVFLRNRLYLGHTSVTSFCVQFEKVGHGLLRGGKRREGEWAVWAKVRGDEKKVSYGKFLLLTTFS